MVDSQFQDLNASFRQALAHHQAGRWSEAESLYRRVLTLDPQHAEALRLMGVLARQRGQMGAARDLLEAAVKAKPDSPQAQFDLASALMDLKEMDLALTHFQRAVELRPGFSEAFHGLGNAYAACWFLGKARACYEQALSLNANMPAVRQCLEFIGKQDQDVLVLAELLRRGGELQTGSKPDSAIPENLRLHCRELFPHLLNKIGLTGVGAEVGVREGFFSEHLLQHWNGQLLYSIDPWREFPGAEYADSANVPQSKQDELYRATIRRLMPHSDKSVIWRLTSKEAAGLIPEQSLDFCYLDADHSFKAVTEDIECWYPKLKTGGILGGHDYLPDGTYSFGTFGVQSAVHEFVRAKRLSLFLSNETPFRSWFVMKR